MGSLKRVKAIISIRSVEENAAYKDVQNLKVILLLASAGGVMLNCELLRMLNIELMWI